MSLAATSHMSRADDVIARLTEFTTSVSDLQAVPEGAIDAFRWHLLDTIGCAIAAINEPACRAARETAREIHVEVGGASVIAEPRLTSPELAAFANCAMIRQLELNDTYSGRSGGHPSNMFAALLAVAEVAGSSGADLVRGAHVGWEIYAVLCGAASLRNRGWDPGSFVTIATVAALAATLRLPPDQVANALALACVSSAALGVTRAGELSAWKGCAEAHAVMSAVILVRLARHGVTGPLDAFRGQFGLMAQVTGEFELEPPGVLVDGRTAVERTMIKFHPCQSTAQAPLDMFLRLRPRLPPLDRIERIVVSAYDFLYQAIGGGRGDAAAKWDPQSRETADHSLPYLIAVALTDGEVTLDSFELERVRDPALRPLMRRIAVEEDPTKRGLHPRRMPVEVTIELRDGTVIQDRCEFARGHPSNPATPEEIEHKFRRLAGRIAVDADRIIAAAGQIDKLPTVEPVAAALRLVRERRA